MGIAAEERQVLKVDEATRREFEDFLYQEADLADRHAFMDWLELWSREGTYWLPCNAEDVDPDHHISLVYEKFEKIEERILRLKGKFAHAQQPRSRLMRVVSNIRVTSFSETEVSGTSNFVLGEVRLNRQNTWFGRARHVLQRTPDGLKIRQKKVFILSNDMPIGNLTFIV